jgi:hypothetical protein
MKRETGRFELPQIVSTDGSDLWELNPLLDKGPWLITIPTVDHGLSIFIFCG